MLYTVEFTVLPTSLSNDFEIDGITKQSSKLMKTPCTCSINLTVISLSLLLSLSLSLSLAESLFHFTSLINFVHHFVNILNV